MCARRIGTLVLGALFLATALAVPGMGVTLEEETSIVCANSILADFTLNVVGDLGTVDYLLPAGVCPAHYDAYPSDAILVAGADIIVQMGWEGWLNGLIESTGNTEAPRIKCMGLGEQNLPEHAKAFVDKIATDMAEIMPDHATEIAANAEAYKASIDAKAAELQARMRAEGVEGRKVVVMQWQADFVDWLGFEVVTEYAPPEGLSVQDQVNISTAASDEEVVMIIDNLQSGTDFGARVASQTGKSHVILTNFPSASPETNTYLDMIDYNTDKLIEGAKTYAYRQGEIADLESQVDDLEYQNLVYLTLMIIFLLLVVFMGIVMARSRPRGD